MAKVKGVSTAVQTTPYDADEMAKDAELHTSKGVTCYRCGKDVEKFHTDTFYCKSFSEYYGGRWLLWDNLRRVLTEHFERVGRPMSWWYTSAFEDPVDQGGTWHRVAGIAVDGQFLGRFESPHQPEFSIIYHDPGLDALPEYRHHTEPNLEYVYMGWRGQLRAACEKAYHRLGLAIDFADVTRDLGISGDRTGEEVTRFQVGWL